MFPIVSVGIPTYNRKHYLIKALDSVKNQDYPNIEIIISDNHSTDGTEEFIKELLGENNSNIKYLRLKENVGAKKNWENCICNASGKYMLMLSDDDILEPDAITNLVNALSDDSVLVIGNKVLIDSEDNPFKKIEKITKNKRISVNVDKFDKIYFDVKNTNNSYNGFGFWKNRLSGFIHDTPSAVLFRRDMAIEIFQLIDKAGTAIDLAFDLILSLRGNVKTISKDVVKYRIHSGNDSNNIYKCASSHVGLFEIMVDKGATPEQLKMLRKYCLSVIFVYAIDALKKYKFVLFYKCIRLSFKKPLCYSFSNSFFFVNCKLLRYVSKTILSKIIYANYKYFKK